MLKLSIIVPVYNVEKYLPKCIDSLICGDGGYEIILVNDGSTDGSPAILADYAARYPALIRIITTPNGGLGHARNTGIDAAIGDYLLFVDSDDYLSPDALLGSVLAALDGSFDICIFDILSVNESGKVLKKMPGTARPDGSVFSLNEYPELLFELPAAWEQRYRRELFAATGIRYPDRAWFEDLRTTTKLYTAAKRVKYVSRSWYNYLQRAGSITNAKKSDRNIEIIDAMDDVVEYFKVIGSYDEYREQLEFLALKHILLASSLRVVTAGLCNDELLDKLLDSFTTDYPDYAHNKYMSTLSRRGAADIPPTHHKAPPPAAHPVHDKQRRPRKIRVTQKNHLIHRSGDFFLLRAIANRHPFGQSAQSSTAGIDCGGRVSVNFLEFCQKDGEYFLKT